MVAACSHGMVQRLADYSQGTRNWRKYATAFPIPKPARSSIRPCSSNCMRTSPTLGRTSAMNLKRDCTSTISAELRAQTGNVRHLPARDALEALRPAVRLPRAAAAQRWRGAQGHQSTPNPNDSRHKAASRRKYHSPA
ncbi:MAG: hypothetical protein U5L03_04315 [Burkholderiaceae bacterium]|nr:hypothetical protein [Burkholderiaceae bacterium]